LFVYCCSSRKKAKPTDVIEDLLLAWQGKSLPEPEKLLIMIRHIILATGTSQLEMLKNLVAAEMVDFSRVTMFHLDEYIAMGADHPASFRKFLKERFVDQVPGLKALHFVNGDAGDPQQECRRVGSLIAEHPIDAAMIGIGENGHLAFNDPPADFETEEPYLVVELDEKCRKQQLGEGWFETLEQVPRQAISMRKRAPGSSPGWRHWRGSMAWGL